MPRFLLNDVSLHGQFTSSSQVIAALRRVYEIRRELVKAAFSLEVAKTVSGRPATAGRTLRQVLFETGSRDLRALVLAWFDRDGPFWDTPPMHNPGEYFECLEEVVADSALAEAAMLLFMVDVDVVDTVSFTPSRFQADPLVVRWRERQGGDLEFRIRNHTETGPVRWRLAELEQPPRSWPEMLLQLKRRCPLLLFSEDIVGQLGTTFYPAVAERSRVLLSALNELVRARRDGDEKAFNQLHSSLTHGQRARFSDSSDRERSDAQFKRWMTFKHPRRGDLIFCPWHAKIQAQQFRIHFEWPIPSDSKEPLFVAYIGPKITRR